MTALALYILAQIVLGAWVSRRVRTRDDYLLAGRSFGYVLATGSIFATWFGAETCVSSAGEAYDEGVSLATVEPFAYGACILLMGAFLAAPLWRARLTTLGDLFRVRYGAGVERLAVLLMIPSSLLWAAAQVRAFGYVVGAAGGVSVTAGIAIATGVVVVYTMMGGLLADAATDLVQGAVLIVGLAALAIGAFAAYGRLPDPSRIAFVWGGTGGLGPAGLLEAWAAPICGSVVAQELVSRVLASRSPAVARRSACLAGILYLAIGSIPLAIGLVAPALLPGLSDPEQVVPALAAAYLPAALRLLVTGALVSAILSTVDSTLLACTALAAQNLVLPLRPGLSPRAQLRLARAGVLVFGAAACGMALAAEGVGDLVEEASRFASAGIFVVVMAGLFWRRGGPGSAIAALAAGGILWVAGGHLWPVPYPYLLSLGGAAVAYLAGALVAGNPAGVARGSGTGGDA